MIRVVSTVRGTRPDVTAQPRTTDGNCDKSRWRPAVRRLTPDPVTNQRPIWTSPVVRRHGQWWMSSSPPRVCLIAVPAVCGRRTTPPLTDPDPRQLENSARKKLPKTHSMSRHYRYKKSFIKKDRNYN